MALRPSIALGALFLALAAHSAHAGLFRAYLSSKGSDTNPCTLPAPCRLLPAALAAVDSGGEVWMLDSANYNTDVVAITKSVTVLAIPGVVGSLVSTGNGALTLPTPNIDVTLRNLAIVPVPLSAPANGIHVTAEARLTLQNSTLHGFGGAGILIGAQNTATFATVHVLDCTLGENTHGVQAYSGAYLYVLGSRLRNGLRGIDASSQVVNSPVIVRVDETVISNMSTGITAVPGGDLRMELSVTRSRIDDAGTGLRLDASFAQAAGTLTAHVVDSVFARNAVALQVFGVGGRAFLHRNAFFENATTFDTSLPSQLLTRLFNTVQAAPNETLPPTTLVGGF